MHNGIILVRAAIVLVCLSSVSPARADASDPGASLKDDFQRLVGTWRKKTKDLELQINFDGQAVQISISGMRGSQGFTGAGVGRLTEVKEDAQGRYFELEPSTAHGTGLPQRIYYRLDEGTLVLDVSEGGLKGQHELARYEGPSRSYTLWIVSGGLLIVVLVVAGVILVRKPAKTSAEPGAAADRPRD